MSNCDLPRRYVPNLGGKFSNCIYYSVHDTTCRSTVGSSEQLSVSFGGDTMGVFIG